MVIFRKETHRTCYGPEVMAYPTVVGINDWGEVEFQEEEDTRDMLDELVEEERESIHTFAHAHVEIKQNDAWSEIAVMGSTPEEEENS